jgi:hypothetical protein
VIEELQDEIYELADELATYIKVAYISGKQVLLFECSVTKVHRAGIGQVKVDAPLYTLAT